MTTHSSCAWGAWRGLGTLLLVVAGVLTSAGAANAESGLYGGPLQLMLKQVEVEVAFHAGEEGRVEVQPRVLAAMAQVPRHEFVSAEQRDLCYESKPIPLGGGRKLPPPYMAAMMADLLDLGPASRVLEIGTTTGYQAAVMSLLAGKVVSIESRSDLARAAAGRLGRLGFDRVEIGEAEGLGGWPSRGPYDAILVRSLVSELPSALIDQLAPGGVLLAPVVDAAGPARLVRVVKTNPKRKRKKVKVLIQPLMVIEPSSI